MNKELSHSEKNIYVLRTSPITDGGSTSTETASTTSKVGNLGKQLFQR